MQLAFFYESIMCYHIKSHLPTYSRWSFIKGQRPSSCPISWCSDEVSLGSTWANQNALRIKAKEFLLESNQSGAKQVNKVRFWNLQDHYGELLLYWRIVYTIFYYNEWCNACNVTIWMNNTCPCWCAAFTCCEATVFPHLAEGVWPHLVTACVQWMTLSIGRFEASSWSPGFEDRRRDMWSHWKLKNYAEWPGYELAQNESVDSDHRLFVLLAAR